MAKIVEQSALKCSKQVCTLYLNFLSVSYFHKALFRTTLQMRCFYNKVIEKVFMEINFELDPDSYPLSVAT